MTPKPFFFLAGALSLIAQPALATSIERSLAIVGDLCATDLDPEGGTDDCIGIAGNIGTPGVHEFVFTGLTAAPAGPVTLRLTSTNADLYEGAGQNNPNERFRLVVGGVDHGLLFDGTTEDEARVNASLAASVQANIEAATGSAAPMDLEFTVSAADFAAMAGDGTLRLRVDFREDRNINRIDDLTATIRYDSAAVLTGNAAADAAKHEAAIRRQE